MLLSNEVLHYFSGHVALVCKFKKRSGTVVKPRLGDSSKRLEFTAMQADCLF